MKLILAALVLLVIVALVPGLIPIKIGEMVEAKQEVRLKPDSNILITVASNCTLGKGDQVIVRNIADNTIFGVRIFKLEKPGCSGWTTSNQVRRVP
jgi:hypothetical protein